MIQIENFRGCSNFSIGKGAYLLSGRNGAGKSSIIEGAGLASICAFAPPNFLKKDIQFLIKTGHQSSSMTIGDNEVKYPDCTVSGRSISDSISAGFERFAGKSQKDLVALLSSLSSEITIEDLQGELPSIGEEKLTEIHELVKDRGADEAFEYYKTQGSKLKGRWEAVTKSKKYGSDIARKYIPEYWQVGLDSVTKEELEADIRNLEETRDSMLIEFGEYSARIKEAERHNGDIDEKKRNVYRLTEQINKIKSDLEKFREIQKKSNEKTHSCPSCGASIVVKGVDISLTDGDKSSDIKYLISLGEKLTSDLLEINKYLSENEKIEIDDMQAPDTREITDKIISLDKAIEAKHQKEESEKINNQINEMVLIVNALSLNGIRAKKTSNLIESFNSLYCLIYPEISLTIDKQGFIRAFGLPYICLSIGEKKIVDIVCRIAWALNFGHKFLAIDMADRLTENHFKKIIELASRIKSSVDYILVAHATDGDLTVEEL